MSSKQINKLTSNTSFNSRKIIHSSQKNFGDLGKEPNQRKDLFRAYLDVRQHSTPFEEDKANYLSIVSETPAKCHQIYQQSTDEYFSGGHRGIYAANPTFKMNLRQTREVFKKPANNILSMFPKETPEEVVPRKIDAKPFSCNEESKVEIKTIRIPPLEDENKENAAEPSSYYTIADREPERKHFPCPNTFENVFGGRYDRDLKNETQNNHIDYDKMQVINLEDDNLEKSDNRELYRMANGSTRCATWNQENARSRRVMHWAESLSEDTNNDNRPVKKESYKNLTESQSRLSCDNHASFRIEDTKMVQAKPVRNIVLNNLEDSKSIGSKASSATLNDSFDPFDTKSWFKSKEELTEKPKKLSFKGNTPTVRSVTTDKVVPSSDPLFVVNYEDSNENIPNKPDPPPRIDNARSSINAPILKKQSNKPKPNQNKGLLRSECNWFREKHVYNRDNKNTFKPECRYNFSCTTANAPKPS